MELNSIILFPLFIFSVIFHEYAHGLMAQKCGDDTASVMGRLTLNPLKHIDLFGTIILPAILILSGLKFIIGWAKPVPINPTKFKNYKIDIMKVALAGVFANFMLVIFTLFFLIILKISGFQNQSLIEICKYAVYINIMLIVFNLIPIVPLDGSKIIHGFLPYQWRIFLDKVEPYGFIILLILINIPIFRYIFWSSVTNISESLLRIVL
jgi:Zn-dependent protease